MRTPQINTYKTSSGKLFKAFEVSVKFVIDYNKLQHVIIDMLQTNDLEVESLNVEISKTVILKKINDDLWIDGSNLFEHGIEFETYKHQADEIIKTYWFDIWEDYHQTRKDQTIAKILINKSSN